MNANGSLLQVRELCKHFALPRRVLRAPTWNRAVDQVSLSIPSGSTLALVGESGSGKTTVGLMVLGLLPATSGEVIFDGRKVTGSRGREWRSFRREMQIVFQDPYSSLNARLTVRECLVEGMQVHRLGTRPEQERRAAELLEQVGLTTDALDRYPHEFSGGQRQRIAIARALSVEPRFLICDEPTSALDVSVQSQVLNLLRRLQRERGLTYMFITHNLAVVEYMADEVAVMQRGRVVERGTVEQIFDHPKQEYTRHLLESVPSVDIEKARIRRSVGAVSHQGRQDRPRTTR